MRPFSFYKPIWILFIFVKVKSRRNSFIFCIFSDFHPVISNITIFNRPKKIIEDLNILAKIIMQVELSKCLACRKILKFYHHCYGGLQGGNDGFRIPGIPKILRIPRIPMGFPWDSESRESAVSPLMRLVFLSSLIELYFQ